MAFSFFGSASNPTHNGSNSTSPAAVTPPGSMAAGDLVVLMASTKDNFADAGYSISTDGGQSWNTTDITGIDVGTNRSMLVAWCIFDGTWDADPAVSASVTQSFSVIMVVARPDSGETVAFDTDTGLDGGVAPSDPFDVTITPTFDTATNDEFVLSAVMTVDDDEWQVQTGGWTGESFDNQQGTDMGLGIAYQTKATAGAVGDVVWRQTANGGDAWVGWVAAWKAESSTPTLDIDEATHGHTADNLALTQHNVLAIQDATHGHTADNVVLGINLIVQDATHGHTADNLGLTQHHVLAIADATHAHAADNLALTQHNVLAIQDATHAHTADNLVLTQHNVLAVADALHAHAADNLVLTAHEPGADELVIQDAAHAHTADALVLGVGLVIADATHAHTAENLVLTQHNVLVIQDALHAHTAEVPQLSIPGETPDRQDFVRLRRRRGMGTR